MSRYAEVAYTLPSIAIDKIVAESPFHESDMAAFSDEGGVTVVVPHLDGTYAEVLDRSLTLSRIFLDTLLDDDTISVPVPFKIVLVDTELLVKNLLQDDEVATVGA